MNPTRKVFVVTAYGGEWEDKWERCVGVCNSIELAKELKHQTFEEYVHHTPIPIPEFEKMLLAVDEYEEEHEDFNDDVKGIKTLFPQYAVKDIERTYEEYYAYNDFVGVHIEEINYYE